MAKNYLIYLLAVIFLFLAGIVFYFYTLLYSPFKKIVVYTPHPNIQSVRILREKEFLEYLKSWGAFQNKKVLLAIPDRVTIGDVRRVEIYFTNIPQEYSQASLVIDGEEVTVKSHSFSLVDKTLKTTIYLNTKYFTDLSAKERDTLLSSLTLQTLYLAFHPVIPDNRAEIEDGVVNIYEKIKDSKDPIISLSLKNL